MDFPKALKGRQYGPRLVQPKWKPIHQSRRDDSMVEKKNLHHITSRKPGKGDSMVHYIHPDGKIVTTVRNASTIPL